VIGEDQPGLLLRVGKRRLRSEGSIRRGRHVCVIAIFAYRSEMDSSVKVVYALCARVCHINDSVMGGFQGLDMIILT
jgi:hypothetical protein